MAKGNLKHPTPPTHLRIFLASPGDVSEERTIAREVIERLPYDPLLRGRITVDLVTWDGPGGAPMEATLTPQAAIERGLTRPAQCDIVVVILWSRLGTALPTDWETRPDGSPYRSGTEWEYLDAVAGAKARGVPRILLYRRAEEPSFRPSDPAFMDKYQQWQAVESFFADFRNADGSVKGGYNGYETPAALADLLEDHLKALIKDRLGKEPDGGSRAGQRAGAAMHAELHGSGAIAQGDRAVAIGQGGVGIGGDATSNVIITGDGARVTQHIWRQVVENRREAEILDKWVNLAYPEKSGLLKDLKEQGYEFVWSTAKNESERVDLKGWERVLVPQPDGGRAQLKVRDDSGVGGYLILLRRRES